ncbi:MAG: hypothetical protein Q7J32_03195 [Sphingomonadaceae bacterium]|nr:hypothetical protein [Sphingomonadaceae bacterium]
MAVAAPQTEPLLVESARAAAAAASPPALQPLLDRYRLALATVGNDGSYKRFPPAAAALQDEMLDAFGGTAFAAAHAGLMVEAIADFAGHAPPDPYPPSIIAEFERAFARILHKIAAADWTGYAGRDDRLWKDFGLARQRVFPASAWVVTPDAGYDRGFLLKGGLGQFLTALPYMRGNDHWLTCNLNEFEKHRFNEAGFRELIRLLADVLRVRPRLSGLFLGASWLYSPVLPRISPRLDFHRRLALPGGARIFFVQPGGADSMALIASETRRQAFADGRYRPDDYILIWRRDALIAWADAQAA